MNSDAKQEIDSLIEITAETVVDITDKYNADSQIVIERLKDNVLLLDDNSTSTLYKAG